MSRCSFALVYYERYRRQPSSFSFNSDILQVKGRFLLPAHRVNSIGSFGRGAPLHHLEVLLKGDARLASTFDYTHVTLPSGITCRMFRGDRELIAEPFFVMDEGETMLFKCYVFPVKYGLLSDFETLYKEEWLVAFPHLVKEIEDSLNVTANRLASLASGESRVWSLWDFIYFSAIVQTTIGFGDMLPNSTPVRRLVFSRAWLAMPSLSWF